MDPPDSAISEGGGKWCRILSPSSGDLSTGRSTASAQVVVDEPSSQDNFSATANRGNVNEEGETDETEWSAINTEEVQDQCNYTDKIDQCPVDIINHY